MMIEQITDDERVICELIGSGAGGEVPTWVAQPIAKALRIIVALTSDRDEWKARAEAAERGLNAQAEMSCEAQDESTAELVTLTEHLDLGEFETREHRYVAAQEQRNALRAENERLRAANASLGEGTLRRSAEVERLRALATQHLCDWTVKRRAAESSLAAATELLVKAATNQPPRPDDNDDSERPVSCTEAERRVLNACKALDDHCIITMAKGVYCAWGEDIAKAELARREAEKCGL